MKVIRAKSAGFCWGVERAIQVEAERQIELIENGLLHFRTVYALEHMR